MNHYLAAYRFVETPKHQTDELMGYMEEGKK